MNTEIFALYLAYKDPRVKWYARLVIAITIGYALSPIDLIPDFVPVLGYLDDLVLVPAGVALSLRLIPKDVMNECRLQALELFSSNKPRVKYAVPVVVFTWLLLAAVLVFFLHKFFGHRVNYPAGW